jgi:hypothetical protein
MSVNNFNPVLWSKKILKELDKQHFLVKNCTTSYSGEITGLGSKVKINSINTPTIGDYVPNSTTITPEQLKDESRMLEITQAKYFAFYLDDIDEKQTTGGLIAEGMRKAVIGLKDVAEQFVAGKYTEAGTTVTEASATSGNILSTLMKAKTILLANNVSDGEVILEVSPYVLNKMVLADIVYTDTGKTISSGRVMDSIQLGMKVFVSNNLVTVGTDPDSAQTHCLMRTKEAVGYAEQIMKTVKYMPENAFSEACKGLHVYGAKTLKPKEFVHVNITCAAESTI